MMTNSTTGIEKMVCDLDQAFSTLAPDKQVPDEDDKNDGKVAGSRFKFLLIYLRQYVHSG